MKRIKFLQKTILTVFVSLMLISCGASLSTNIQQTQLGTSRNEVTAKLGTDFQVVSMVQTEQGNLEILRYTDRVAEDGKIIIQGYYILHFLDGKLVELNYEEAMPSPVHPPRPHPRPHK